MITLLTLGAYFALLLAVSRLGRSGGGNAAFFQGNRSSPWYLVAFGMIGASISGITLVSVTGMVQWADMTYLMMCFGYIPGYLVVALCMLPVYYSLNLISIYSYLRERLGPVSYRTGAGFFMLSKLTGAAARFYVVCLILDEFVLSHLNIPFYVTVPAMMFLIWLYTRHSGIRSLVYTDVLQTACILIAIGVMLAVVCKELGLNWGEAFNYALSGEHSRIIETDPGSRQNFLKQFFSGMFVVIVMTGLDQDMMQKNMTCRSAREARMEMCLYGLAFVPLNLLLMVLGVLLLAFCAQNGIVVPEAFDRLLPSLVGSGVLGNAVEILFVLGIVAASFSSADSALTALTTTCCVDILQNPGSVPLRQRVHLLMAVAFTGAVLIFGACNSRSLIDVIFVLCGYTYGPLLGLFVFAHFVKRQVNDREVPYLAILAPLICYGVGELSSRVFGYRMGYELLMLNGALTLGLLYLRSRPRPA